jgi:heme a synthase
VTNNAPNKYLYYYFAAATAAATFLLLGLGGLVTSKGVGMAVPDWPTTYGYNMFVFPFRLWTGGIFYEHTHRLLASFVGLLTTILAVWIWLSEPRRWLRWLGVGAFFAVVLQGILGGLRVTQYSNELGVLHGALAQLFFVTVCLIALYGSGAAQRIIALSRSVPRAWRFVIAATTAIVFIQLGLGAMMRHQHAGLAIPDFPLAYGSVWPPMNPEFVETVNHQRMEALAYNPITGFQIGLHMAHRLTAFAILLSAAALAVGLSRDSAASSVIARISYAWLFLILLQAALGAFTVWTNKAADVATAHVLVGALVLLTGVVLTALTHRIGERSGPTPAS